MSLSVLVPPAGEIITVDEAKSQCRVTHGLDDAWFADDAIPAAVQAVEDRTARQLFRATLVQPLDRWPCSGVIELKRSPVVSVSSITYLDMAGATQTWAASNYRVDAPNARTSRRARIGLAYGATWPSIQDVINAVSVTFIAGYGTSADTVPPRLRRAMKMLIGHWYENRETVLVGTISKEVELGFESLIGDYICHATQRED